MELDQVPRYYVMPLGACRAMTSCPLVRATLLRNVSPTIDLLPASSGPVALRVTLAGV